MLIFDNRLLWQTVSNGADKSTETQTVLSGGFLWLNPTAVEPRWYVFTSETVLVLSRDEIFLVGNSLGGVLARFRYRDD